MTDCRAHLKPLADVKRLDQFLAQTAHVSPANAHGADGSRASTVWSEVVSDLVVDPAEPRWHPTNNQRDDPIRQLLFVGNAGGFRPLGSPTRRTVMSLP